MYEVPIAPTTEPPGLGPDGRLQVDILCVRCGYNLRGLHGESICPECGTSVGHSLRGDLLVFSDPDWVERLSRAANWIVAATAIGLVSFVLSFILSRGSNSAQIVLNLLTEGVTFIGYWLLTTPEPRRSLAESPTSPRVVARVVAAIALVIALADVAAAGLPNTAVELVRLATAVVTVAYVTASYVYLRRLALRIPNEHLARRTRVVLIGSLVCAGPTLFLLPVSTLTGVALLAIPVCLFLPGMVVFNIWGFVLMLRYRKAFREAAAAARASWAAEPVVSQSVGTSSMG